MDTTTIITINMQIIVCRHGETDWTLSGQHTGVSDIPLTEAGKQQGRDMGRRLKAFSFAHVFSSPRRRAFDTATLAGLRAAVEPDAAEWDYGSFDGLTTPDIQAKRPGWNLFQDGAPNGESPQEVSNRADRLLHKLSALQGNIALFSHGHFLRVLTARWLGLPVEQGKHFYLSVASVGILGFERQTRVIRLWNDTDFLKKLS
jgi:probable phosphoglycerate mutase